MVHGPGPVPEVVHGLGPWGGPWTGSTGVVHGVVHAPGPQGVVHGPGAMFCIHPRVKCTTQWVKYRLRKMSEIIQSEFTFICFDDTAVVCC